MKIKRKIGLFYIFIFYVIFIMTLNYPNHPDEYMYSYIFGTDIRISYPLQLLVSLKKMYFEWSGRIISNFLQQFFIFIGKDSFVVLNSFIFIFILFFSSKFILKILKTENKFSEFDILKINLLILMGVWFYVPAFSQDFIWMVGSLNYAWPLLLNIILFYYFIENKDEKNLDWKYILLLLLVAISNESGVIFTGLFMFLEIFLEILKYGKCSRNKIKSLVYFFLFSLIQVLAPGNMSRIKNESTEFFPKNTISEKFFYIVKLKEFRILMILIIVFILLIFIFKLRKIKIPISLLITSILNLIVFIFILPRNENRALLYPIFGLILFLTILMYQILNEIKYKYQIIIILIISSFLLISVIKILNYYSVEIKYLESIRKTQLDYYKSREEKEIVLEKYSSKINNIPYRYQAFDFLETSPESFANLKIGKYFGFDKLYAVENGKKLLVVNFTPESDIKTLRFDMYGIGYSALYNFDKKNLKNNSLFLEIPKEVNRIDIRGHNFIIKNIKILKILDGKEFESNENIRTIEIR